MQAEALPTRSVRRDSGLVQTAFPESDFYPGPNVPMWEITPRERATFGGPADDGSALKIESGKSKLAIGRLRWRLLGSVPPR
jgi:hypothetical protein